MSLKFVAVDEEGYFLFGDKRVTDEEIGSELIKNLKINDIGAFQTALPATINATDMEDYIVEAFSEPLVIQSVNVKSSGLWGVLPYGVEIPLNPHTFSVDEWDRFHGYESLHQVPWVMSRKAQNQLFELADEFDDDSITLQGKKIIVPPYWSTRKDIEQEKTWQQAYENKNSGWDMKQATPVLQEMLPKLKLNRSRVLVLGSGYGHDAAHFAEAGHLVTAVDFAENAIAESKKKYGHLKNLTFLKADAFHLPQEFLHNFDLVFEHTFFCAVNPVQRSQVVSTWRKCLAPGGNLFAVFMIRERKGEPPFGATEWEIRERLKKDFQFLYWARWRRSIHNRDGKELFVYAEKKS